MPLFEFFHAIRELSRDNRNAYSANNNKLAIRLADVFARTWDLGFIAFGGPPVHFQILHHRFVMGGGGKTPWIDEQTASFPRFLSSWSGGKYAPTAGMAFTYDGSLPGAIGMYGLSLGVQRISNILPGAVYALLSGLNSSTVGIVALAAVQLAEKAIKDRLSRILIIFGACAGLCYNALWYFPILILLGGIATVAWDTSLRQRVERLTIRIKRRRHPVQAGDADEVTSESMELPNVPRQPPSVVKRRPRAEQPVEPPTVMDQASPRTNSNPLAQAATPTTDMKSHGISTGKGLAIMSIFIAILVVVLVTRGVLPSPPLPFSLFANMYLAGTVIFGGGPVVIPLLREYVVQPGWVSSRDFLLGLAIIQAFPGPNFNFSVYLGALALQGTSQPTALGALLGYLGIFVPGLVLAVSVQGIWRVLRTKRVVVSLLRGINATAVGLVFTAVYRLWEIGYLTPEASSGQSLAMEPWWVVVAAVTYAESAWFNVPPAVAILLGAVLGLCWYGVVRA